MRLTSRERQILDILRKEPLLPQEDLAARLGITRSSVAVHISNLMKKGIILGKGYVFNDRASCVVLGDVLWLIDVKNRPNSNTSINLRMGGFGYWSSLSLAKLGMDVKLLSYCSNDANGNRAIDELVSSGVDISYIQRWSKGVPALVNISDNNYNNCYWQNCSLDEYRILLEKGEWLLNNCEWLLVQPDLLSLVNLNNTDTDDSSGIFTCIFENEIESNLEIISGVKLLVMEIDSRDKSKTDILKLYLDQGTGIVVATDGHNMIWAGEGAKFYELPISPGQEFKPEDNLIDFGCGIIYGLTGGYPLRQAIRIGLGLVTRNGEKI
ncbi:MAG: winged helix-turn-helix transcriptional regulator [Chitinophagales bacterium]